MTKTLVEQQFGPSAAHYAECEVHAAGESLARILELTKPETHWRALDIATGAGHTAAVFAPHVATVVASDITSEMLDETAKLAAQRGLTNLKTAVANAARLPFADAEFDLVTCRLAAHHFPDPQAFVSESARVLKPGGTFALVDNIPPDNEQAARDYNAFEKLRDPSHARALSTQDWMTASTRAALIVSHHEVYAKEMAFDAWVERMRCSQETIRELLEILQQNRELADFLRPRLIDGQLNFSLRELILIAHKP